MSVWVLSEGYYPRMVNPGVEGGPEEWAAKLSMAPEYEDTIYFFAELVNEDVPTVPLNAFKGTYAIALAMRYGCPFNESFATPGEAARWLDREAAYDNLSPVGIALSDGSTIWAPRRGGSQMVWKLIKESDRP